MPAERPVIRLVKLPKPPPLEILPSEIVGVRLVELKHIPLAVTVAPPSEVTLPPDDADWDVMSVMALMVTVGATFKGSFLQLYTVESASKISDKYKIDFTIMFVIV